MLKKLHDRVSTRRYAQEILADTLSRLPNPINNDDVVLDVRVDGLALEADDPQHLTIALINFPVAKQQLLNDETLRDPVLNALKEIVYSGWPDNLKELVTNCQVKQIEQVKEKRGDMRNRDI